MPILTHIALIGSLIALALGFVVILGEGGYGFDLRRSRARRSTRRAGGRRAADWASAK